MPNMLLQSLPLDLEGYMIIHMTFSSLSVPVLKQMVFYSFLLFMVNKKDSLSPWKDPSNLVALTSLEVKDSLEPALTFLP